MINNKSAIIWAFEEMIDDNTYNDGLAAFDSIYQMKYIFRKVFTYLESSSLNKMPKNYFIFHLTIMA